MEHSETIWQQRLVKRRSGMTWKTIIEAEGFKYGGTFTRHLKQARDQGWIPPEDELPPAIRSDGRRQGILAPKQEGRMSAETVEVRPEQTTITENTAVVGPVSAVADIPVVGEVAESLSLAELQTLEHYERIIAQGFKTFVEVGQALVAIRDQRLYRQDYGTFEDYLRQRWDLSRPYAYQLIDASVTVQNLSATADILPANEAQARPLTSVPPDQQAEVWQEAVKTAPPSGITAAHVKKTVSRAKATSTGTKPAKPKSPAPEPRVPPRQRVQDGLFTVLSMVKGKDAWKMLGDLAQQLSSYAEEHEDPNLMQRMEQALLPLWHMIEDHQ
jgi:hypothetical protein